MPELPEVETVIRTLEKQLQYPTITNVKVSYDKIIATSDVATFVKQMKNETIVAYHRYGKYLVFECKQYYLIAHMRMEGKFYIQQPNDPYDKHTHVFFDLDDGRQL